MKTKSILLTLSVFLICSIMVYAQEKAEIWSWAYYKAPKGKTAELEKAVKDKTEKFNKLSVDPIYTYRVMSGSRSGQLVRVIGPKDWSYYEKGNEGLKYWNQTVDPLVAESSGREFYERIKNMSYNGKTNANIKYVEVVEFTVKADKEYDFANFVRGVTKAVAENKSKRQFDTFRMVSGGTGTRFVIVWSYESLSEMDDQSENWSEWYNKMKGSGASWHRDFQTINASLEIYGSNSFLCSYAPELSSK